MNLEDGTKLVNLARLAISSVFSGQNVNVPVFKENNGVFVNLIMKDGVQKGSIGSVYPVRGLGDSVVKYSRLAAFSNKENSLKEKDLKNFVIEVCFLTYPKLIKVRKPEQYFDKIIIGKDGLFVDCDGMKAILLPKVAVDHKFDAEKLLNAVCQQAGLLPETWKEVKKCKIYSFQVESFKEKDIGIVEKGESF